MATAEQSIRVTAKGEFSQLQHGLKDLQGDLKDVMGEINKGARKGGIFDDSNLRALDTFKNRFKDTMGGLDEQFRRQNQLIDQLAENMKKANMVEQADIGSQIKAREKELDVIRRQIIEVEKLYNNRNKEAGSYEIRPNGSSSSSSSNTGASGGGFALSAAAGAASKVLGAAGTVAKVALGLAGITSALAMIQTAYQTAYAREVGSLDLAQRIRGTSYSGNAMSMYKQSTAVGQKDKMGYSEADSWAMQDAYSSKAGGLNAQGQYDMQKFARGYGLDGVQTAGTMGIVKQLGGTAQPKQFADMIAASVSRSGMLPRIAEVMAAHTTLLQNINTSFKDGSSATLLAYQTTLDRLGNANGMTKLTGEQGAGILNGLGGIYKPGNDKWQWEGIKALQNYDPKKYGKMGMYELQSNFEDGLSNTDNLPAMAKQLKTESGGNNDVFKRLMQQWLQDGGFNATKTQVTQLDKVTDGFTAFDKGKIDSVMGVDSGSAYDANRKNDPGQAVQSTEAAFNTALGNFGEKFIPQITQMKSDFTDILNDVNGDAGFGKTASDILKFLTNSKLEYVLGAILALKVLGGVGTLSRLLPGVSGGLGGGRTGGTGGTGGATGGAEGEILAGGTGGAGGAAGATGEIALGANIRAGELTASEAAQISRLAGGNGGAQVALTQVFKSTGDMDAVTHAATKLIPEGAAGGAAGEAANAELISMMANGSTSTEAMLTEHFAQTGSIGTTAAKAAQAAKAADAAAGAAGGGAEIVANGASAGSRILAGGGSALKAGSKVLTKIPLLGGAIDFGINVAMGDSAPKAGSKAVGMMGGSMAGGAGGAALGGLIGGGIGALFGGVGAVPGAAIGTWVGGLGGSIGGGMAGDTLGGKAYDSYSDVDKKKNAEAAEKLKTFATQGLLDVGGLSTDGVAKLEEMREKGLASFGSLDKTGRIQITGLSTEGAKQLAALSKNGSVSLASQDKTTTDKLTEIASAHTTFLEKIGGVFGSIGDWFDKKLGIATAPKGDDTPSSHSTSGDVPSNETYNGKYSSWINDAATKNGLDPTLLAGLIKTESNFDPTAVNPKSGATGLGQFLASTAKDEGLKDRTDAQSSIYATAAYLKKRITWAGGNVSAGIKGYGEGTDEYLNKVLANQQEVQATQSSPDTVTDTSGGKGLYSGGSYDNGSGAVPTAYDPSVHYAVQNMAYTSPSSSQSNRIVVDVNLKGEGASQLNSMTTAQLKSMIAQAVADLRRQQLAMNPTTRA